MPASRSFHVALATSASVLALTIALGAPAQAATITSPITADYSSNDLSFLNLSTITGTVTAVTLPNATDIENRGTITSGGNGLEANSDVADFTNRGTVSATNIALWFTADVESFTNSGSISSATNSGVRVVNITDFTNTGSITSSGSAALWVQGNAGSMINEGTLSGWYAVTVSGTTNTFLNKGTLESTIGDAVTLSGAVGTFNNQGTVTGSQNGVTLESDVESFSNSGTIIGTSSYGVSASQDVSTFSNSGSIYGADYGVVIGGNVGSLTNAGTISAVSNQALEIGGDVGSFVNTGTFFSNTGGVRLWGNVDAFRNAGTITSLNLTAVTVDGDIDTFTNSGTITGNNAGVFFGGDLHTFVNTGTISAGNTVYVYNSATAVHFINGGTITAGDQAIGFSVNDDTLSLLSGSNIEGYVSFDAGTDLLDLSDYHGSSVLEANQLESIDEGNNLVTRFDLGLSGEYIYITSPDAIIHSSASTSSLVATLDDTLTHHTPAPGRNYWVSSSFSAEHSSSTEVGTGVGTLTTGAETAIGNNTTLGGLVSLGRTSLSTGNGSQLVTATTGVAGIYGRTSVNVVDLTFQLLGGVSANTSDRTVAGTSGEITSSADFTGWFVAPQAGISIPVLDIDNHSIRLGGKLGAIVGGFSGYSEDGSEAALVVDSQTYQILTAAIDLTDRAQLGKTDAGLINGIITTGVFVQSNLGGSTTGVDLYDEAGGALLDSYSVAASTGTVWGVHAGLAVEAPLTPQLTLSSGIDVSYRSTGSFGPTAHLTLTGSF